MPSGDQVQHARFRVGSGISNTSNPVPSALIDAVATRPSSAKAGKINRVPSGDHSGPPTAASVSRTRSEPSGSTVNTWQSSHPLESVT